MRTQLYFDLNCSNKTIVVDIYFTQRFILGDKISLIDFINEQDFSQEEITEIDEYSYTVISFLWVKDKEGIYLITEISQDHERHLSECINLD